MWPSRDELDYWRAKCRDSFWWFYSYAYGVGTNPDIAHLADPQHRQAAEWFESHIIPWMAARKAGRGYKLSLMVIVPRDWGKTTLFTRAGQLWLHVLDPDLSSYTGSETKDQAARWMLPIKETIRGANSSSLFVPFYGNWCSADRTWGKEEVVHGARTAMERGEPSFGIWGVETGLTGCHPDALIFDDPISYERLSAYSNWLEIVNAHTSSLIPVLQKDGLELWVGTRYHQADHFGTALRLEGVRSVTGMQCPGVNPSPDGKWHVLFWAGRHDGKPTMPGIWDEGRLKNFERKDPLRFAAQVMNDPSSSEFVPLTTAEAEACVIENDLCPNRKHLVYTFHFDTAFKKQSNMARGDESVLQIWGHLMNGSGDVYFIEGYSSHRWTNQDFLDRLVILLQDYKRKGYRVRLMTDEPEMSGKDGLWEAAIRDHCATANILMPPLLILHRGGKKKEVRHREATHFWHNGHVKLLRSAPGLDKLIDQMSHIGNNIHDDWVDCATDVFHKEVYRVMRLVTTNREDAPLRQPWDDVLQGRGREYTYDKLDGVDYGRTPD